MGAYADVEKAKASRNIRRGKGKMRNRRYVGRKGPLVVFGDESGIAKAFRNLPGVETASVDSLNLLQVQSSLTLALRCLTCVLAYFHAIMLTYVDPAMILQATHMCLSYILYGMKNSFVPVPIRCSYIAFTLCFAPASHAWWLS